MNTFDFINEHHNSLMKWILKDCKCNTIDAKDTGDKEITNNGSKGNKT